MKTEWWYDASFVTYETLYNCSQELWLARLSLLGDTSAQILFPNGVIRSFSSESEARMWLCDEEYRRLDDLLQDFIDDDAPTAPAIRTPTATCEPELLEEMRTAVKGNA